MTHCYLYKETRHVFDLEIPGQHSRDIVSYHHAISVDKSNGNIYIASVGHAPQISAYSSNGDFITRFSHDLMPSPWGLVVDGLNIYVTDIVFNGIVHFREEGPFCQVRIKPDSSDPFKEPRQLALSDEGELYIADYGNHRIKVLDNSLASVRSISHASMSYPIDVKVTPLNVFSLSFIASRCIHIFSLHGEMIRSVISCGQGMQVSKAYFFCIDSLKRIIISDAWSNEIKMFSQEGELMDMITPKGNEMKIHYSLSPIAIRNNSELVMAAGAELYAISVRS